MNDRNVARIVSEFCDELGYDFRPHYSGRGMYGDTCIGIVHADASFEVAMQMAVFIVDRAEDTDDAVNTLLLFEGARYDNMAGDVITYWPRITASDEETEE
jgi:hypothetical protein